MWSFGRGPYARPISVRLQRKPSRGLRKREEERAISKTATPPWKSKRLTTQHWRSLKSHRHLSLRQSWKKRLTMSTWVTVLFASQSVRLLKRSAISLSGWSSLCLRSRSSSRPSSLSVRKSSSWAALSSCKSSTRRHCTLFTRWKPSSWPRSCTPDTCKASQPTLLRLRLKNLNVLVSSN